MVTCRPATLGTRKRQAAQAHYCSTCHLVRHKWSVAGVLTPVALLDVSTDTKSTDSVLVGNRFLTVSLPGVLFFPSNWGMFPVLHLLDADRVVKSSGLLAGWPGTWSHCQVGSSCAGRISGAHTL
jgi:hypothetical protein